MVAPISSHGTAADRRSRNPRGQGERLREEILQAADVILAASGDARLLSLRGVAKQVGIAATSVYLHLPDVDHLKVALVERGFADLNAARDAASEGVVDPIEALLVRLRAYAHWGLDHPGRYRLMFGPELPPALAYDAERSPGRQAFGTLVRGIQRCQEAGASLPQPSSPDIATSMIALPALRATATRRRPGPGSMSTC